MVNTQLVEYIKKKRAENIPEDKIVADLIQVGWSQADLQKAWGLVGNSDIPLPTPPALASPTLQSTFQWASGQSGKQEQGSMWDAFQHILMFISLYTLAISIILLLGYYIDRWFPAFSKSTYSYSSAFRSSYINTSSLFGYLSAIIVSLPIFAYLFIRISNRTATHPELRLLSSRLILIYITLFLTFIVCFSSLIAIVYTFLRGNITLNFVLHILVYLGICGAIFYYYVEQVKEDKRNKYPRSKLTGYSEELL